MGVKPTIDKVRDLRAETPGMSAAEIARQLGLSRERIRQILNVLGEPTKMSRPLKLMLRRVEYLCWANMIARCYNPKNCVFSYYGARGISVCPEWAVSFERFYQDMGPKPSPKHSIDRINNDGNYEPGNCRWTTKSQQSANQRKRRTK